MLTGVERLEEFWVLRFLPERIFLVIEMYPECADTTDNHRNSPYADYRSCSIPECFQIFWRIPWRMVSRAFNVPRKVSAIAGAVSKFLAREILRQASFHVHFDLDGNVEIIV